MYKNSYCYAYVCNIKVQNIRFKGAVTLPKSRVNTEVTHKIRDLRDTSAICAFHKFFLTWHLLNCPPMFAVSALYAIPGFEQLKTWLRVRVHRYCAVLRNLCVVCVVLTRTMCEICVEYQWLSAKMLPLSLSSDDFPLTMSRHIRHVSRVYIYVSLKITEKNYWRMYL